MCWPTCPFTMCKWPAQLQLYSRGSTLGTASSQSLWPKVNVSVCSLWFMEGHKTHTIITGHRPINLLHIETFIFLFWLKVKAKQAQLVVPLQRCKVTLTVAFWTWCKVTHSPNSPDFNSETDSWVTSTYESLSPTHLLQESVSETLTSFLQAKYITFLLFSWTCTVPSGMIQI